jgi:hypothetical protein
MTDEERDLDQLRQRWPEWEIDHRWFGWVAWPRGVPVLFAVFADSLEQKIIDAQRNPPAEQ